jgi:protocatechuate 3,4-dioxygenase beta subunit
VAAGWRLDAASPRDEPKAEAKSKPEEKPPVKAETLNYTGTVRDKDTGKPIAGASVTVRRSILKANDENRVLQETKHTTDADGKYSFTIPPEQTAERSLYIELDVEHPDYATQAHFGYALGMIRKNEKLGGRPFFENVELRPAQKISGRVQGPDGQPAKGVKVLAYSVTSKSKPGAFEYGSFAEVKTDDQGQFHVVVTTPGHAVFWLLPDGAAPEAHRVQEGKRDDLGLFVLDKGLVLKGRVLDAQGKPVAGIYINAERDRAADDNTLEGLMVADAINRSALTEADGSFAMAPLPPGTYRIQPAQYARDGSGGRDRRALPAVFVAQKLLLKPGEMPEPLEVRAVPHAEIEVQWVDAGGKPTWGFNHHIFGQIDGTAWFGEAAPDGKGHVVARVPHGMENVQLNLMTNEHHAIRYRMEKGGPLQSGHRIMLGTLDHDVRGIEIVHYNAPVLIVKASTKDGKAVPGVLVSAEYTEPEKRPRMEGKLITAGGVETDVSFEAQEDGRYRSSQLLPELDVAVKAQASGFKSATAKVRLPEGKTEEVVLTLEPK